MKNKISFKLVSFLLAVILCLSAACTTALAAEEPVAAEAKKPEIISQNVMYGGNFSLMFAVDASTVSGDTVTLRVYDAEPADGSKALWSKTISSAEQTTSINGTPCFVFTTPGVAAKDMDKNYYVVAESAGVESDVKKYSVAKYLYERLYGDQVAFGTSALEKAQAKLYFSTLEFGKNAQDLLFNYDEDTTNDRTTFVTDLCYVTVNSKNGIKGTLNNGESAILVKNGESVSVGSSTIKFNGKNYAAGEFEVQSISGSEIVSTSTLSGNTVVATSHLIIDPTRFFSVTDEPAPETFEGMETVDTTVYSQTNMDSLAVVGVDGESRLKYSFSSGSNMHYAYFRLASASKDALMLVWEGDVDFDNIVKDGIAAGETVNNAVRIVVGSTAFNIHVTTTGLSCYDTPDNWYGTISTSTDHKAHIRIEYFETVDSTGAKVFDTNFYVDGDLKTPSGAKKYVAYSDAYSVDSVTNVQFRSDSTVGGEYYFDNVKIFKTFAPEELFLNEYETFDGDTVVDSSKVSASTSTALSIVKGEEGDAMKVSLGTSAQEKISFYPMVSEEAADKVVFEFTFTDYFATETINASTTLTFYAGSEKVYDFRFNNGKLLTAESNGVSWALKLVPGETYTLRFELWMNGTELEIDVWCNGEKVARPSGYGTGKPSLTTGRNEDLVSNITRIEWLDGSTSVTGYYIVDNVRFSKLNTAN